MCWRLIAQELNTGRTSKQCREHYLNSLRPNMKKGQWTQKEEVRLGQGRSSPWLIWRTYTDMQGLTVLVVRARVRLQYIIAREHAKNGSHWCIIAKKLPGR